MLRFFLLVLAVCSVIVDACTTLAVGKKATADGSVMASHSADGGGTTDPRLVRIPGGKFAEGAMRPVFGSPESYPRYVGVDPRSPEIPIPEYLSENCEQGRALCRDWKAMGEIPQVRETYAYSEAVYGVMNEKKVGIAESTCSAVYAAQPLDVGGNSLLSINALSQIALERAASSREAVQLMGDLAVKYGFYGASHSFEGGAESLIVIDEEEAFVFHVLAGPGEKSAIWAAQRVPDDSVVVVANMFVIREMDMSDTFNFLGRQDMWDIAEAEGLWQQGQPRDFVKTFSDGEYAHKYYSGRRMWGVFRLLAPDTELPAEYGNLKEDKPYEFSYPVSVDKEKVTPKYIFSVMRDYYNGTHYSLGAPHLGGGAWGSIDRFGNEDPNTKRQIEGNWERSIALYRTAESYVVQSRRDDSTSNSSALGGVAWFGAQSATYTAYVPTFYFAVPDSLSYGWQGTYNLTSNFWTARRLAFACQYNWNSIITYVREYQHVLETQSHSMVQELITSKHSYEKVKDAISHNAAVAVKDGDKLFNFLLFTFADGFINKKDEQGYFTSASQGYPEKWLLTTEYPRGPPPVSEVE